MKIFVVFCLFIVNYASSKGVELQPLAEDQNDLQNDLQIIKLEEASSLDEDTTSSLNPDDSQLKDDNVEITDESYEFDPTVRRLEALMNVPLSEEEIDDLGVHDPLLEKVAADMNNRSLDLVQKLTFVFNTTDAPPTVVFDTILGVNDVVNVSSFTFHEVPEEILRNQSYKMNNTDFTYDTLNISQLADDPNSDVTYDKSFSNEVPTDMQELFLERTKKNNGDILADAYDSGETVDIVNNDDIVNADGSDEKVDTVTSSDRGGQYFDYVMNTYFPKDFANAALIKEEMEEKAEAIFEHKIEEQNEEQAEEDSTYEEGADDHAMDFL